MPRRHFKKVHSWCARCSLRFKEPVDYLPAAAHELPFFLFFGEGVVLVGRHDRHVCVHYAVHALLREREVLLRVLVALVVEENASQSSRFAAVLDVEVLVCPLFELGVVLRVVLQ